MGSEWNCGWIWNHEKDPGGEIRRGRGVFEDRVGKCFDGDVRVWTWTHFGSHSEREIQGLGLKKGGDSKD